MVGPALAFLEIHTFTHWVHPGGKKCVDLIGVVHRSQWSYNFPAAKREKNNDAGEILKNKGMEWECIFFQDIENEQDHLHPKIYQSTF